MKKSYYQKTFKEKLVDSIQEKIKVNKRDAESMANGLISGKIPYIKSGNVYIEVSDSKQRGMKP